MNDDYPVQTAAQLRHHLKSWRKARGMTQAQLGARMGVSQARIAEIEANPALVGFEQLMQLFAALEVGLVLRDNAPPAAKDAPLATPHDTGAPPGPSRDADRDVGAVSASTVVAPQTVAGPTWQSRLPIPTETLVEQARHALDHGSAIRQAIKDLDQSKSIRQAVKELDQTDEIRKLTDMFAAMEQLGAYRKKGAW